MSGVPQMGVFTSELFLGIENKLRHLSKISSISHPSQSNSSQVPGKCVHLCMCAAHKECFLPVKCALQSRSVQKGTRWKRSTALLVVCTSTACPKHEWSICRGLIQCSRGICDHMQTFVWSRCSRSIGLQIYHICSWSVFPDVLYIST